MFCNVSRMSSKACEALEDGVNCSALLCTAGYLYCELDLSSR